MAGAGGARQPTSERVCQDKHDPDRAFCMAMVRTDVPGPRVLSPGQQPPGLAPRDIQSAYELPSGGNGRTVAITVAYHDPNLESDLAVYRRQFHLPPCTKANRCLRVINQFGATAPLPTTVDPGWALEESLDVDAVSAVCPHCKILVVEANNNRLLSSLLPAVDQAVAQGAKYVSNSWAGPEQPGEGTIDFHFRDHPGVAFVFGSGDAGGQVFYPSVSPYVTSVGGTSLYRADNRRGWAETAWSGSGAGCSLYEPKPPFQDDTICPNNRTTADVSAVADPYTGFAVYDTVPTIFGLTGWQIVGGTSLSTPLVAATYALAGKPAPGTYPNFYPYAQRRYFHDIVTGCAGAFCAHLGYDAPTGIGTPNGVRGLRSPAWGYSRADRVASAAGQR
ncbi:S53 family peptidase [Streptomyces sp. NPDC001340]